MKVIHSVALLERSSQRSNTIVLRRNVLFLLPFDLDGAPDEPDRVRLRCLTGGYCVQVLSNDPSVEYCSNSDLLRYPFPDVPYGLYALEVWFGDRWFPLFDALEITVDG